MTTVCPEGGFGDTSSAGNKERETALCLDFPAFGEVPVAW